MRHTWKGRAWGFLYGIVLTAFTAFVLLDTFVIPRSYAAVTDSTSESTQNVQSTATSTSSKTNSSSAVVTDTTYESDDAKITITTYREDDTNIYVADIQVTSVEALKAALAGNTYGRNVTAVTSSIASSNNAVLAINGDYYGARDSGYVVRNGTLYRSESAGDDQQDLVIYQDGSFDIVTEGSVSAETLVSNGAWQVFSFGPGLLEDGEITVDANTEVDKAKATNPRTAIGEISPLHYVLVVADGRTDESTGLSLYQMAEFLKSLGVQTAYNLDGGGSSTMYFNGSVINQPTTDGNRIKERKVSDIVYIA